jgi:putative transposase
VAPPLSDGAVTCVNSRDDRHGGQYFSYSPDRPPSADDSLGRFRTTGGAAGGRQPGGTTTLRGDQDLCPVGPRAAQQFLSALSQISPHFRPRRHLLTATDYRTEMLIRFAIWDRITGTTALPTAA